MPLTTDSLIEMFDALLVAGDAVVRSLRPRKDQIRDFSSAEADSGRKLDLHVVGLLEAEGEVPGVFRQTTRRLESPPFTLGLVPKKFRPPSG